jgi:hypothetical protein
VRNGSFGWDGETCGWNARRDREDGGGKDRHTAPTRWHRTFGPRGRGFVPRPFLFASLVD